MTTEDLQFLKALVDRGILDPELFKLRKGIA